MLWGTPTQLKAPEVLVILLGSNGLHSKQWRCLKAVRRSSHISMVHVISGNAAENWRIGVAPGPEDAIEAAAEWTTASHSTPSCADVPVSTCVQVSTQRALRSPIQCCCEEGRLPMIVVG